MSTPINLDRIQELLGDHIKWHDRYQIQEFIVRANGATWWGQYRQTLRELKTRWELLQSEAISRVEHALDLQEAEDDAKFDKDPRRAKLKVLRLSVQARAMDEALHHRVRELLEFYALACAYSDEFGKLDAPTRETLAAREWQARDPDGEWKSYLPELPTLPPIPEITDRSVSDILCLAQEAAGVTPDLLPAPTRPLALRAD